MNLAISNIAWNTSENDFVYSLMQKYNFTGLEIAPTKIIPEQPYSHITEAASWSNDLHSKYGFSIPSMQSIWFGRTEKLFGSQEERKILVDYTKAAIDFASAIGCKNIVFGCPKNRNKPDGVDKEIAVQFFHEIGEYASSKNTCIGMEANPAIYGTNFVNTTEQAVDLIERVNSKGFKLNLDAGTMIENEEPVSILLGNEDLMNHVHISEPYLKKILIRDLHKNLYSLLKEINYTGFISVEMGYQNNLTDIEDVMKYMRNL